MADATGRPRRMRHSFETRCRAVTAMLTGLSPSAAVQAIGAGRATGNRLAAARFDPSPRHQRV